MSLYINAYNMDSLHFEQKYRSNTYTYDSFFVKSVYFSRQKTRGHIEIQLFVCLKKQ